MSKTPPKKNQELPNNQVSVDDSDVNIHHDMFGGNKTVAGSEIEATGGAGGSASSTTSVTVNSFSNFFVFLILIVGIILGSLAGFFLPKFMSNDSQILNVATPSPVATLNATGSTPQLSPLPTTEAAISPTDVELVPGLNFEYKLLNTLAKGSSVYELTDHFMSKLPDGVTVNWELLVEPQYTGTDPLGKVEIQVKDKDGNIIVRNGWNQLDQKSTAIQIPLDMTAVVKLVARANPIANNLFEDYAPPEAKFSIDASTTVRGSPRSAQIGVITIRNTPWYHTSRLSTSSLSPEDPPKLYVTGKNLGEASEFFVIYELFKVKDIGGNWWATLPNAEPWDRKAINVTPTGMIGKAATFATTIPLKQEYFGDPDAQAYVLNVWVAKKQNYTSFGENDWLNPNKPIWTFADDGDLLLLLKKP